LKRLRFSGFQSDASTGDRSSGPKAWVWFSLLNTTLNYVASQSTDKCIEIFVVSTPPKRATLGGPGVSKLILAQATTTFHTQASTGVYSTPDVLGLDSNIETSYYTNSVDIWSLRCVIYELLVGTWLFPSEAQVSHYYFDKWRLPEDRYKEQAFLIGNAGISVLKSTLIIQHENHLIAMGALSHRLLGGFTAEDNNSRDDHDETIQNRDQSNIRRKRENTPATSDRPKKRREGNPITRNPTRHISGGAALEANARSLWVGNHTAQKTTIDASVATPPNSVSSGSSLVQAGYQKSKPMPYNFHALHSADLGIKGGKSVGDFSPKYFQTSTPNTKLNLNTKLVANENPLLGPMEVQCVSFVGYTGGEGGSLRLWNLQNLHAVPPWTLH